jgi:hypothetical protein
MTMDDRIRISDADRERVTARLREHFAEGRLSSDELDERITATLSAKTFGDLRAVMADLPDSVPVPPGSPQGSPAPPWAAGRWAVVPRGPRLMPLVIVALIAAVIIPGAGWLFLAFVKVALVIWLIACLAGIIAALRFRRHVRRFWPSGPAGPGGPRHPYWWRHYQWRG